MKKSRLQQILEKLQASCSYGIGIVDESGEWALSGEMPDAMTCIAEIAGSFAAASVEAVKDKLFVCEDRVYTYVLQDGKPAAALILWGPPAETQLVAPVLRMACETMLDAEFAADRDGRPAKCENTLDYLGYCLLYENVMPPSRIRLIAYHLGYNEKTPRVAVLISLPCLARPEKIRAAISACDAFHKSSILVNTREEGLWVLFHALREPQESGQSFANTLLEIKETRDELKSHLEAVFGVTPSLYVGSVQNSIPLLRHSYLHARWLMESFASEGDAIFYDHLQRYFIEQVPYMEIYNVMHLFSDLLGDTAAKTTFIRNIEALQRHCYNLSTCSSELYIHKNTLILWLKKLSDNIGIDPQHNSNDRELAKYLCYYLKKSLSKIQEW